jgi:hypothetical protein
MAKKPILWNRLGSDTQAFNSPLGPNLTKEGNSAYTTGQFGNGYQGGGSSDALSFPANDIWNNNQVGTTELWWKPTAGWDTGGSGIIAIGDTVSDAYHRIFANNGDSNVWFEFSISGGSRYLWRKNPMTNFSAGTWYHLAIVWDANGIDGSSDKSRNYIDGVIDSTDSTAIPNDTFGNSLNESAIGNIDSRTLPLIGVVDNIKCYDYAKTDFNDRFNERGGLNDVNIMV